jgi:hypothetical protein
MSIILFASSSARPCDWHGNFLNEDEPPIPSEPRSMTDWTPFVDRQQFETADFLFKCVKMLAGNIDHLLQLWAATGEAPFTNHADLYDTINAIPLAAFRGRTLK